MELPPWYSVAVHPWNSPMPRFHQEQEQHDELITAIGRAAHLIANAIKDSAMSEAQALADLSTAVTNLGTAITAEIAALQAALAANVPPVDNSPAIETAVTNLNNLAASLTASIPVPTPPPVTPAPTPAP